MLTFSNLWMYLVLLMLNSFLCLGVFKVCDYDTAKRTTRDKSTGYLPTNIEVIEAKSIFWFVKFYGTKWFGSMVMMPICGCVICMASLHSIYVFWPLHDFTLTNLVLYVYYVFCLAGVNTLHERYT
jgi:hypothetical protein